MRDPKIKILENRVQRAVSSELANGAAAEPPVHWWRSVMRGLGATRRQRAEATLQHLAQSDVTDTISEADVQGWLSMLEAESAKSKAGNKFDSTAPRGPVRR